MQFFPRGRTALSEIFNFMIDYISREFGHVLKSFDQSYLTQDKIELLCDSISRKGSPYKRCFGFIDGTVRPVCRPSTDQREVTTKLCKLQQDNHFTSFSSTTGIKDCIRLSSNHFCFRMASFPICLVL